MNICIFHFLSTEIFVSVLSELDKLAKFRCDLDVTVQQINDLRPPLQMTKSEVPIEEPHFTKSIERRLKLPASSMVHPRLWRLMVLNVPLICFNEPIGTHIIPAIFLLKDLIFFYCLSHTGMLQRLCEVLEYSELLDEASETKDPYERMVLIAAFAVSAYGSSHVRVGNPFTPLLGETYENVREDKGFKYISEKVNT